MWAKPATNSTVWTTSLIVAALGAEPLSCGRTNLTQASEVRARYINALGAVRLRACSTADQGCCVRFVRR
jgi:hypothetical protein